jgi:hypothetical protein
MEKEEEEKQEDLNAKIGSFQLETDTGMMGQSPGGRSKRAKIPSCYPTPPPSYMVL